MTTPIVSKHRLEQRIKEINTQKCPKCGARLWLSLDRKYLFCENQWSKDGDLEVLGKNNCHAMITSLEILEESCRVHNLKMPLL